MKIGDTVIERRCTRTGIFKIVDIHKMGFVVESRRGKLLVRRGDELKKINV